MQRQQTYDNDAKMMRRRFYWYRRLLIIVYRSSSRTSRIADYYTLRVTNQIKCYKTFFQKEYRGYCDYTWHVEIRALKCGMCTMNGCSDSIS